MANCRPPRNDLRAQWTKLPSRLSYSPLLRDGVDSERAEAGRIGDEDSAGRLAAGLLVVRRAAGRDRGAVLLGREVVEPVALGLAVLPAVDLAVVLDWVPDRAPDASGLAAALPELADDPVDLDLADVRRRPDDALGPADDLVVCRAPVRGLVVARDLVVPPVDRDRVVLAGAGLTDDIVLAAAVRALAAVDMALVAVFIDFMADDMVLADTVALVAAAVILLAAEFTLVAAEDTVLAAVAGDDAEPRAVVLRVERDAVARDPVARDPVARDAVERDATERDPADRGAVLRVDREAVLRVAVLAAVPLVDLAAPLRVAVGLALDVLELDVVVGRLAVLLDALRLTDLLRAGLAELRRLAARVVD
jgi:hypothetical protein